MPPGYLFNTSGLSLSHYSQRTSAISVSRSLSHNYILLIYILLYVITILSQQLVEHSHGLR